ncbi:substrate-binding domain-containing protein [Olivibacter sp. SDN3]|uniref:PstS family phosphate ABC transporter substrate-binding protein n=1 Tax=Olivibacter sp. SDN3 TaxID=2764720 RepID=UPI001650D676|nr:substrate-binding domain-containing protein [Olivibacter sp. SDN3]QNL50200.1 substrate-binding domain-containing protein [Olivibacter sp. SDN3]
MGSCAGSFKKDRTETTETIAISGAFALYPMVVQWSEDFRKIHPEVRFNISAGGAGKGIADVLSGMVDIGLVSRDIHPEEFEKGGYLINVANDAVVATFNSNNPAVDNILRRGLTKREFVKIFVEGDVHRWSQLPGISADYDMHVYVRSDAAGAAETWAKFLDCSQEDLSGIGVFGDPGQAQAIMRDPLSIGFSNLNYVYSLKDRLPQPNVQIIPVDWNENGKIDPEEFFYQHLDSLNNAIGDGRYPSPPARTLGFLFHGRPENKTLLAFIEYILSPEGQARLPENGYVKLSEETVAAELKKIQ